MSCVCSIIATGSTGICVGGSAGGGGGFDGGGCWAGGCPSGHVFWPSAIW